MSGNNFIYRPKGSRVWITSSSGFIVFWVFRFIGRLFARLFGKK
jgi:hypothetical protein